MSQKQVTKSTSLVAPAVARAEFLQAVALLCMEKKHFSSRGTRWDHPLVWIYVRVLVSAWLDGRNGWSKVHADRATANFPEAILMGVDVAVGEKP